MLTTPWAAVSVQVEVSDPSPLLCIYSVFRFWCSVPSLCLPSPQILMHWRKCRGWKLRWLRYLSSSRRSWQSWVYSAWKTIKEGVYGAGGTNNCSPYVKGGYRDTSIHGFQRIAAKENSNGIQRDRSSDQAVKVAEWVAHRNCGFSTLSNLNQIKPDQPNLNCEVNTTLSRIYPVTVNCWIKLWRSHVIWLSLKVKYPSEMA